MLTETHGSISTSISTLDTKTQYTVHVLLYSLLNGLVNLQTQPLRDILTLSEYPISGEQYSPISYCLPDDGAPVIPATIFFN